MLTSKLGKKKAKKQSPPLLPNMIKKKIKKQRRSQRVRAKLFGTAKRPRLCVFRSAKHIYAQLVDDEKGKTIVTCSDRKIKKGKKIKTDMAQEVGKLIARAALEKKIEKVVFDRGPYQYHGRVKALAEGARQAGLKF
jgi:large subunit ribosomal protein L18